VAREKTRLTIVNNGPFHVSFFNPDYSYTITVHGSIHEVKTVTTVKKEMVRTEITALKGGANENRAGGALPTNYE
jgi:hypothetical protein